MYRRDGGYGGNTLGPGKKKPMSYLHVLEQEIPAGRYGVGAITCRSGTTTTAYKAGRGKVFAEFTVAAGEVVNLGTLSLIVTELPRESIFTRVKHVIVPVITPLNDEAKSQLRPDVIAKLETRHLRPSNPLTTQQLKKLCNYDSGIRKWRPVVGKLAPACSKLTKIEEMRGNDG